MRAVGQEWGRLGLGWDDGLRSLPFFTQRIAVLLLGVLVATLALLGGVVALIGPPGAGGPTHLVPDDRAGDAPREPVPGGAPDAPVTGEPGRGPAAASGDAAGRGAASPAAAQGSGRAAPAGPGTVAGEAATKPGGTTTGAQGSGGAAGAGAGGPPAAPPTTSAPAGPLPPLDGLLGPVVPTLVP